GNLRPEDLEELLLGVYPRKVMVQGRDELADVMPTMRDLLALLGDTDRIPPAQITKLQRAVDKIEPRFPDAVMDPSRWGTARTFTQAMVDDGVDFEDQAAMDRWIQQYNASLPAARPGSIDTVGEDEDTDLVDVKEALGLPDRLPPLRLPPESELAGIARRSRLLDQAKRLALWVGTQPRTLEDGELSAADTVAAVGELGLAEAIESSAVTALSDVPELVRLWDLAEELDFIEVAGNTATAGQGVKGWPDGTDDDVLDLWEHALADTLSEPLVVAADLGGQHDLDFTGAGPSAFVLLFMARSDGMPVAEIRDMLRETGTAELPPATAAKAWQSWIDSCGDPADLLLTPLGELGAVETQDEMVRLTTLSLYAVRLQLLDADVEVPLLAPPEHMTAADLVEVGAAGSEEELEGESTAWLALRSPESAVDELLAVAASGGAEERVAATAIAARTGVAAQDRWRQALDQPVLRPYAKLTLASFTGAEPDDIEPGLQPTLAELAWLATDALAGVTDSLEPDELVQELATAVPPGHEQQLFEQMWRLDHPNAHEVLITVGRNHPDKLVAKAARKAAYKIKPPAKRR
ncbi:MAG: hypothetical protein ACRDP4_14535, partial [Nocardioidaceae bacterium]